MKMSRNGLISYDEADGFGNTRIASIFEDRAGELCVIDNRGFINRLDGDRFTPIRPNLPKDIKFSWGWYQTHFQDSADNWWVPTLEGLYLYPKLSKVELLASATPQAVYTTRDGLSGNEIFRLYEDSRGDVWIGTLGEPKSVLTRWERATGKFHRYSPADNVLQSTPSAFCEDASGNIWIGFYGGGLIRYSAGRFLAMSTADGLPAGFIRGLYLDGKKRLWVSTTQGGLGRVDDPGAERPTFATYTTTEGLSSNHVTCVTEDQWGRIYIGTGRGLDRLDPATGRIKQYTVADGLADSFVQVAYRDARGTLWFGTYQGLTRVIPEPDHLRPPAPALISGLRIAGFAYPISDLGTTEIPMLELNPGQNNIEIDFFGLSFSPGERIRYQYKLEGSDQDWRPLTLQRTVNYASLPSGAYRFVVQAVNPDGTLSASPATVAFNILPPLWRRWWFITLAALLIAGLIFGFDRYRVARVKEVEAALTQSTMLTIRLAVQQENLRKANRTLALDYTVTSILSEAANLNDAAPRILKAICESTGWEIGELWDADPQAGVLRCVDVFHIEMKDAAEFERLSKQITFLPGVGLPGRVLAAAEPLWIADLADDTNFPRMEFAVKEGLRSAFGFPILLGNSVLGVLEFFSRETRERDQDLLDSMSTIGSHFGQLLERKRGDQKLRESESRFRTLAETASDAIITIDEQSTIIYVNRAAQNVFGHSVEEMLGQDLTMLMPEYLRHLHKAGLARYAETGKRHIGWEAVELPGLHKDGREIPLELSFGEFTRHNQRLFTGIARDITERKRAEEALRKSREERLIELEHVRRRIATDLHDDIGSSLSQIFLLSEVAQQRIGPDDALAREPLSMIADASHELVGSMSDIVWAINPQKDHLSDLVQRMRRFAGEVLEARNIELRFRAPGSEHDVRVGASIRREVFLVFKESVNNLARHSQCREADIEFSLENDVLMLKLSDNGRGFDPSRESDGHGLVSMRERAQSIGGLFELISAPDKGTTITLQVPLDQPYPISQTMPT
jgi:PAS domain S-box-containing protein